MKSLFEKNGGTYTRVGDYYLPNLETPNGNYKICRYGRARRQYSTAWAYIAVACIIGIVLFALLSAAENLIMKKRH